ncbi:hypothetical protein OGATHE_003861 [Ogataea polymorpha]|uniref:RNase MRP protein 1 RNA binding domain-containing protein n=1 Tax=Ogataea polymorpha TaxID=460523 RepID=A0A9P8T4N5_9ASCO|nr:hypothetical protein OGATHE_003861 [Ogataea polymorpha]
MEAALLNEYQIAHLVYHRDSKQHRSSLWWKHFNIFHRRLRTVLQLCIDIDEITGKRQLSSLRFTRSHFPKFQKRTLSATQAAQLVQRKKQQLQTLINYLLQRILPACYYRFYAVIELGQYLALGFTLMGLVAKTRAILLQMRSVPAPEPDPEPQLLQEEEVGELIAPAELVNASFEEPRNENKKKRNKSRKTIDDIFGF